MGFNPLLIPTPRGETFIAVFGERAWSEFLGRIMNTQMYFSLRYGSVKIDDAVFFGDSGIDDGWIMHMAKSIDDYRLVLTGNKDESPGITEAAREFAWRCERRMRELQGLDTVQRLFMQSQ